LLPFLTDDFGFGDVFCYTYETLRLGEWLHFVFEYRTCLLNPATTSYVAEKLCEAEQEAASPAAEWLDCKDVMEALREKYRLSNPETVPGDSGNGGNALPQRMHIEVCNN
jgi:hypothetical protein